MTLYRKKPEIVEAYDFSKTKVDKHGKPLYDRVIPFKDFEAISMAICPERFDINGKVYLYDGYAISPSDYIVFNKFKRREKVEGRYFLRHYEPIEDSPPQEEVTFKDCEELIEQRFGSDSNYEIWGSYNDCRFWNHDESDIKFATDDLKEMYEFIKNFKPE